MTAPEQETRRPAATGPAAVVHLFCCDPGRAFCGADVSGELECVEVLPGEAYCVVCADLDGQPGVCTCSVQEAMP